MPDWAREVRVRLSSLRLSPTRATESVTLIEIAPALERYTPERTWSDLDQATARLAALPGVHQVSAARLHPLRRGSGFLARTIEGYSAAPQEEIRFESNFVAPGYFTVLGVDIRAGREFSDSDREGAPLVGVISETMARRYWAGRNPLGARITSSSFDEPIEIIGMARDVTVGLKEAAEPFVYLPLRQHRRFLNAPGPLLLLIRTAGSAPSAAALRSALRNIDPLLPVMDISSLEAQIGELLMPQRLGSTLLSTLAGLTLVLVTVGIVGMVSYGVSRRRREIGVRLALGARRAQVTGAMMRGAVLPVMAGLLIGVAVTLGLARVVSGFLYEIDPTDLLTYVVSSVLLVATAGVAAWVPAYRASGMNPTEVLGTE